MPHLLLIFAWEAIVIAGVIPELVGETRLESIVYDVHSVNGIMSAIHHQPTTSLNDYLSLCGFAWHFDVSAKESRKFLCASALVGTGLHGLVSGC